MPRADKAPKIWAEYAPNSLTVDDVGGEIVRVWTAASPALWSAVDAGNKVVGMKPGETLVEALMRDRAEKAAAKAKPTPPAAVRSGA